MILNIHKQGIGKFVAIFFLLLIPFVCFASDKQIKESDDEGADFAERLPRTIFSGVQGKHHVQGVAVDLKHGFVYYSFTTSLLKTDMFGHTVGSVTGLTGHLGCITINPVNGLVYGSLEYKNDEIGQGIAGESAADRQTAFYVAIFDVEKINTIGMNAETDSVMKTVYLREPVFDYSSSSISEGYVEKHRFGCSGIDGITFAPEYGNKNGKMYLNVAYGIYGDTTRKDNDYQVILAYDIRYWGNYAMTLSQKKPHHNGPIWAAHKYFVYTGNTTYGIQNLAYDSATGNCYAAVYPGEKRDFPNYSLFIIDGRRKARKEKLAGIDEPEKASVLRLLPQGLHDPESGIWGWHYDFGATGLCPLGNGFFYISKDATTADGRHSCTLSLYRWTGIADHPFTLVK